MTAHAELRDDELNAFIDGELDETNRQRVADLIERSPEIRERVTGYRADKARIRALYSGGLNDPLPRAWIERIEQATTRRPWQRQVWGITALAASFVLVLSGVIGFREFGGGVRDDIVADALAARADALHPDRVIPVSSTGVAAVEAGEMTQALATRVKAPDLSQMGYRLVDIGSYSTPKASFELRYADASGGILTLYVRRSAGSPRFDQFKAQGLRVCVWQDDVVGMVMAGTMSVAEMQHLASAAYNGMEM